MSGSTLPPSELLVLTSLDSSSGALWSTSALPPAELLVLTTLDSSPWALWCGPTLPPSEQFVLRMPSLDLVGWVFPPSKGADRIEKSAIVTTVTLLLFLIRWLRRSVILEIRADFRLIQTEVFCAPYALRFPRVQRIRFDKPWNNAMTTQGGSRLHCSVSLHRRACFSVPRHTAYCDQPWCNGTIPQRGSGLPHFHAGYTVLLTV